MVAVEGTTDEDDKYFTEEEEILWPANLYPGGFPSSGINSTDSSNSISNYIVQSWFIFSSSLRSR